ncbi:MAG: hypothetical protein VX777_00805 [Chlamydiota bacterium]|nr:hypothetical protein [Chlamydiota bacterium]
MNISKYTLDSFNQLPLFDRYVIAENSLPKNSESDIDDYVYNTVPQENNSFYQSASEKKPPKETISKISEVISGASKLFSNSEVLCASMVYGREHQPEFFIVYKEDLNYTLYTQIKTVSYIYKLNTPQCNWYENDLLSRCKKEFPKHFKNTNYTTKTIYQPLFQNRISYFYDWDFTLHERTIEKDGIFPNNTIKPTISIKRNYRFSHDEFLPVFPGHLFSKEDKQQESSK